MARASGASKLRRAALLLSGSGSAGLCRICTVGLPVVLPEALFVAVIAAAASAAKRDAATACL